MTKTAKRSTAARKASSSNVPKGGGRARPEKPTEAMSLRAIGKRGKTVAEVRGALRGSWSDGAVRNWLDGLTRSGAAITRKEGHSNYYMVKPATRVTQAIRNNEPEAAQVH